MASSTNDFFKDKEDRNDFYIALPVIAIALLFVLWQWNKSYNTEDITPKADHPIEMASVNNIVESHQTLDKDIPENVDANRSLESKPQPAPINNYHPKSTKQIVSPDATPREEKPRVERRKKTTKNREEMMDVETNKAATETKIASKVDERTAVKIEQPTTDVEKPKDSNSTPIQIVKKDCSIAIGLYKDPDNLNKMYKRLITDGYAAQITPHNTSQKVSVDVTCNQNESQKILRKIRSSYANDAFIE